jgi:uncharacterized protein (TIGR04255 family)
MPLNLPELDETRLTVSPLVVVICQIRFEQKLVVSDGDTGIKIHEQLGGRDGEYRWIEPLVTTAAQIEISPYGYGQGLTAGVQMNGWRLKSEDGAWTVSILPDNASLETTAYGEWRGDFEVRFQSLLAALAQHVNPSIENRIGLRYVNRIPAENRHEPKDWIGVISPEIIGPLADDFWSLGLRSAQSQLELDLNDGARCLMRHGFIYNPSGQLDAYALDYDIFRQGTQRFDIKMIIEALDYFHKAALAVFQKSLTPSFLSELRQSHAI